MKASYRLYSVFTASLIAVTLASPTAFASSAFAAQATMAATASAAQGTITWGKPNEVSGLDVNLNGQDASREIIDMVNEPLVQLQSDGTVKPWLAESWDQPTPTSYVFHLRKGVTWSNGRAFGADDVVGSINRLLDPKLGAFWAADLGKVTAVIKVDDNTVKVDLAEPNGTFLVAMSAPYAAMIPAKELAAGSYDPAKSLLGTGPYVLKQHIQDSSWSFTANPAYWRTGFPKANNLEIKIIPDEAARIAALRNGQIDVTVLNLPDSVAALKNDANIKVISEEAGTYWTFDLNAVWAKSQFKDVNLRQAVLQAIDKQQIIDLALGGVGKPVNWIPQQSACAKANLLGYNPQAVKDLLAKAGVTNFTFTMEVEGSLPQEVDMAQVMAQQLAAVGITMKIEQLDDATFADKVWNKAEYEAAFGYNGSPEPVIGFGSYDPKVATWLSNFYAPDAPMDALLTQARALPVGADRQALLTKICELVDKDANHPAIATKPNVYAYRTDRVVPAVMDFNALAIPFSLIAEFSTK